MSVIFTHWVADFILQTDWQAKNKSTNNIALLRHVSTYTICLAIFSLLYKFSFEWIILNGVLHFVTDYITSRINSALWKKGDVHNFFVMVGFDQLIHYGCLFGTLFLFKLV